MNTQVTLHVALALMCFVVACARATTTEAHPSEAPAPAAPTVTTDAATAARSGAVEPAARPEFGKDNATGAQLGSAVNAPAAQRNPGDDLNAQVGGSTQQPSAPSKPSSTRVTLSSHRALDAASPDSAAVARRFLGAGQSAVKRCYEAALAREAPTSGTLTLHFAVTTTGHVADATADSWNAALSKCVLDVMPTWTFQALRAQSRFELTLSLVAE